MILPRNNKPISATEVRESLSRSPLHPLLMQLLDQELEIRREHYETKPACEYVRGQIAGVKYIKTLLTNQA
jgi:hypothetical protein